jgi:hypothetical protein
MPRRKYKYGRHASRFTLSSFYGMKLIGDALDPLGQPPAKSNDYVKAVTAMVGKNWGVMLNNKLGDCTAATTGHSLMLRSANIGTMITPTDLEIQDFYFKSTGSSLKDDEGGNDIDVCKYEVATGFTARGVVHKAEGFMTIDPTHFDHFRWAQQIFGTMRLGLNVPEYCQDQFDAGQPWDYVAAKDNSPKAISGHSVPLVDYGNYGPPEAPWAVLTWGGVQFMTQRAMEEWCMEAHVELFYDWVRAGQQTAPSGFDMAALMEKLQQVALMTRSNQEVA